MTVRGERYQVALTKAIIGAVVWGTGQLLEHRSSQHGQQHSGQQSGQRRKPRKDRNGHGNGHCNGHDYEANGYSGEDGRSHGGPYGGMPETVPVACLVPPCFDPYSFDMAGECNSEWVSG